MEIRCMTIADYDQVHMLWTHTPGMGLNQLDDSREGIEKYLKRNQGTCFVAEENGRIIGGILSGHDGRRGFIYHTAVLEAYRKQGIGKKLVEEAMNALEKEGIHKVALVAFKQNQAGNDFWEEIGFEERRDLVYRNKVIHESQAINTL
ncbi:MAG: GNAT family N-acetyltransferase [Lachnospiraceae bacterium]|nr:GNAT family N-acetyltransferase [Lachnospiraceae bacterium]